MALLLIENYQDFDFSNFDGFVSKSAGGLSITNGPRAGSKALAVNGADAYVAYAVAAASTIRFALRVKLNALGNAKEIISFREGSTGHCGVGVNASGYIYVFGVNFGTILKTATTGAIAADTWVQIEGQIVINDSGSAEIRLNGGAAIISESGTIDTRNGATGTCDTVRVGDTGVSVSPNFLITDFAVWNESGESPTGWVGDVRVDTLLPSGAGSSTQWTPSAGSNYTCINEGNADNDTTYIETSTNAQKDLFALANLAHSPGAIHAVAVTVKAKKTDAGAASVKLTMKSGATEAQGSAVALAEASYNRIVYARGVDPNTSSAWTASAVNALEAGIESVI